MSLISRLTPTNLLEEKAKFLADQTYNPQFIYENEIEAKTLTKYGLLEKKYLDLAQEILDQAYFGRNEQDLFMMEGPIVDQNEVTKKIQTFLSLHQLETKYQIVWSSSFVSRTTITNDTIKLRLPIEFRQQGLLGMLYHEIGTHALRRINYAKQPWYKKKKEFSFGEYLLTEEGLASLHTLIPHSFKSAYISAIRYLAISYAREHSFVEVWQFLQKYVQDLERRWIITFRAKRGLTDTSQAGGFTKDMVYLKGAVETWQWLKQNNYNPSPLYFGKLGIKDVNKALKLNPDFTPQLPTFYSLNQEKYQKEIIIIGEYNRFDQI